MARDDAVQAAVAAANRLTARWARTWDVGGGGTVLSGVGVWPLLAALAEAADGATRDELAKAVGLSADARPDSAPHSLPADAELALDAARALLGVLEQSPAVHTALGLWTAASVPVNPQWSARLPAAAHGVLDPDPVRSQAALDAWVEKETEGLLRSMPMRVDRKTLLVLASALTVRTEWEQPFDDAPAAGSGPWADRRAMAGLYRTMPLSESEIRVAVPDDDGPVTLATVRGREGIDVVLALGEPEARPGAVLGTAAAACGPAPQSGAPGVRVERVTPANLDHAPTGPGLTVAEIRSFNPEPTASLRTVAFTVTAHHNLLEHAELFGLGTASDDAAGRFPGISDMPLYVQGAAQDATASFSAEGFVAAAVTAVFTAAAAAMPRQSAKRLTAAFDRPFGFLAVHRDTGLVLVCGWVADPNDYPSA